MVLSGPPVTDSPFDAVKFSQGCNSRCLPLNDDNRFRWISVCQPMDEKYEKHKLVV